jgi:hypothetical protein
MEPKNIIHSGSVPLQAQPRHPAASLRSGHFIVFVCAASRGVRKKVDMRPPIAISTLNFVAFCLVRTVSNPHSCLHDQPQLHCLPTYYESRRSWFQPLSRRQGVSVEFIRWARRARGCRDHNPGPGAGWLVGSSGR